MPATLDSLRRKLGALKDTVAHGGIGDKTSRFPRMASQIASATEMLTGVIERIECDLDSDVEAVGPVENRIRVAFQLWNLFRLKFDQREDPRMERFLRAADELAWLAYKPARDAALGADTKRYKQPPLIYFSADVAPLIQPRGSSLRPDGVPAALMDRYGFGAALPFPLIGVPWFQTGYLPGGLAVAHEAGHAVETDFGLGPSLQLIVEQGVTSADRCQQWVKWIEEMFADLWACLALGPAFLATIAEVVAVQDAEDRSNSLTTTYPPPSLRYVWNLAVLRSRGFVLDETAAWAGFTMPSELAAYGNDAIEIAKLWLETPFAQFANRRLPDVLNFSPEQQAKATSQAERAAKMAFTTTDVRALWAAVQLAHVGPSTERLLDQITIACSSAHRATRNNPNPADTPSTERLAHLRSAGHSLV